MLLEIKFNKEIYKEQTELLLKIYWNKTLKKNKKNLFICIFALLIGVTIIYGNNNVGYIFVIIAIYGFIECYKINAAFKKNKRDFNKNIDEEIIGHLESGENSRWEFNENYFSYQDYRYETKIKWETFKSFRIIENNIILDLNTDCILSYVIGMKELGESDYNKLIFFLNKKIKRTST